MGGGANGNAWPHGHGKGGARESMELLSCVLNILAKFYIFVAFCTFQGAS